MHISNRFVFLCNIQIVIWMLYHSFERLLLLSLLYLMVKSSKSFVKLDLVSKQPFSFCFIEISIPSQPSLFQTPRLFDFTNVPALPLISTPPPSSVYSVPKSILITTKTDTRISFKSSSSKSTHNQLHSKKNKNKNM